jgi:serine/threonine protein kinase
LSSDIKSRTCIHLLVEHPSRFRMISTASQQALACVRRYNRRDFEVAGRIGKGSYGGVWQAKVLSTSEQVVLKVVFPDVDLDPEDAAKASPTPSQLSSFKREIKILAVIDRHPNIAGARVCECVY